MIKSNIYIYIYIYIYKFINNITRDHRNIYYSLIFWSLVNKIVELSSYTFLCLTLLNLVPRWYILCLNHFYFFDLTRKSRALDICVIITHLYFFLSTYRELFAHKKVKIFQISCTTYEQISDHQSFVCLFCYDNVKPLSSTNF